MKAKSVTMNCFAAIVAIAQAEPAMAQAPNASTSRAEIELAGQSRPWMDARLSPDERAELILKEMTLAEKLLLTFGTFAAKHDSSGKFWQYPAEARPNSAGFVPGIKRLGIPPQWETDSGTGVASQRSEVPRQRTSLPSGIALASTWNPEIARAGGAMIGNEAYLSGFNVMLAGGINLTREPRNGRNFEYGGEDPLLAAMVIGNAIKGIQSQNVLATMKHYAFNGQETARSTIDHIIDPQAGRQSDLLAFEIANEVGRPGSVMCGYNRVNGAYVCENDWLLNQVLKQDWGFKGYVMSDWGAVHSTTQAANAGLDQQSGWALDRSPYFAEALREAVNNGHVSEARATDMARRILYAMFANGLFDKPVTGDLSAGIDYVAHAAVTREAAEEAIVLLKNDGGLLPLAKDARSILIVGSHADVGVLSGGGSSQVYPRSAATNGLIVPNEGPDSFPGPKVYHASSPMEALKARTKAVISYLDGKDIAAAAAAARKADVVIVFGEQWAAESLDLPDLNLPGNQNDLISAIAGANPKTIVVLETGGPVLMPWLQHVGAVLEAWYSGTSGGEAIARVLTGEVNPSGRLPVTFPASTSQLPRPVIEGAGQDSPDAHPISDYNVDGAAVGYKWFEKKREAPLFPFGYGLSYTHFSMDNLSARQQGKGIVATFRVRNAGRMRGKAVAQLYVSGNGWEAPRRLGGFRKVDLAPGGQRKVSVAIDPRLLATFDAASRNWVVKPGAYTVTLAASSADPGQSVVVQVEGSTFKRPND